MRRLYIAVHPGAKSSSLPLMTPIECAPKNTKVIASCHQITLNYEKIEEKKNIVTSNSTPRRCPCFVHDLFKMSVLYVWVVSPWSFTIGRMTDARLRFLRWVRRIASWARSLRAPEGVGLGNCGRINPFLGIKGEKSIQNSTKNEDNNR